MSKESKITTKDGTTIKVTGGGKKDNASVSIYSGDYKSKDNHSAIHVNINTKTGQGSIVEHGNNHSNPTSTPTSCYLTSACMKHYLSKFDDNCYELTVLRWFRDNFVSNEDVSHYYMTAPMIVCEIDKDENSDIVYDYIYDSVIAVCVEAIENGDYEFAYSRYKDSILNLEQTYLKPVLQQRFVKILKKQCNI